MRSVLSMCYHPVYMQPFDFFAVGDIVTEPFIKLINAHVVEGKEGEVPQVCMPAGDKLPYESAIICAAVGNAGNAAVAAARLGLSSGLRSYTGDDASGKEMLEVLQKENVDTTHVVKEAGKVSNHHFVLWYGSERTILVKHETFTYTVPELSEAPKWMYLSSLAENSQPYHDALSAWLTEHPETKLAFQPGTFQMLLGKEALASLYTRSDFFVCNKEEAARILEIPLTSDTKLLLTELAKLGPKVVVVTDGTEGAYGYDGSRFLRIPMYPDTRGPYERTGAGDAFTSAVVSALALGKSLDEALLWGPINSMSVVQEVGAQKGLLTRPQLEDLLAKAPSDYRITEY